VLGRIATFLGAQDRCESTPELWTGKRTQPGERNFVLEGAFSA
jgi:hypothetical protein